MSDRASSLRAEVVSVPCAGEIGKLVSILIRGELVKPSWTKLWWAERVDSAFKEWKLSASHSLVLYTGLQPTIASRLCYGYTMVILWHGMARHRYAARYSRTPHHAMLCHTTGLRIRMRMRMRTPARPGPERRTSQTWLYEYNWSIIKPIE